MSIKIQHHPAPTVDPAQTRVDTVATVRLDHITGRILRSVFDGGTVAYEAHIELSGNNSPSQIDDPQDLRNLGTVAIALADELTAVGG